VVYVNYADTLLSIRYVILLIITYVL